MPALVLNTPVTAATSCALYPLLSIRDFGSLFARRAKATTELRYPSLLGLLPKHRDFVCLFVCFSSRNSNICKVVVIGKAEAS